MNFKKPSAALIWSLVSVVAGVAGAIAKNETHKNELNKLRSDTVAETTKQVLESLTSDKKES